MWFCMRVVVLGRRFLGEHFEYRRYGGEESRMVSSMQANMFSERLVISRLREKLKSRCFSTVSTCIRTASAMDMLIHGHTKM